MPRKKISPDKDNPEWTKADFRRARPAASLPSDVLKAFPRTRGTQKAPKKVAVSIRLSTEVVEYFKSSGPGWQSRIDAALKRLAER